MGTSTDFKAQPNWGPVKAQATRHVGDGEVTDQEVALIASFFTHLGEETEGGFGPPEQEGPEGAGLGEPQNPVILPEFNSATPIPPAPIPTVAPPPSRVGPSPPSGRSGSHSGGDGAHSRTGGGGGRTKGSHGRGRGARGSARAFGAFLSDVQTAGFQTAIEKLGIPSLQGKSLEEARCALIDALCGDGSLIDLVDLRHAFKDIFAEILRGVASVDQMPQAFKQAAANTGLFVQKLFAHYTYRRFCTVMFRTLSKQLGAQRAGAKLESIRGYISRKFNLLGKKQDLSKVDWSGKAGSQMVDRLLKEVLAIYGGAV